MMEEYNGNDTNPETKVVDPEVSEGKFFAAIGYFAFLCAVPLYFKRDNKFALFHGKQALVLFILEVAVGILQVVPVIGTVISWFGFLVFGLLSIVAIVKVLMEEYWQIPFISDIAEQIKL